MEAPLRHPSPTSAPRVVSIPQENVMTGPRLYRPRPPMSRYVDYYGYWARGAGVGAHLSRALPRGAATVIIDVSGRTDIDFYAADGLTPLQVPPAFIAGAGVASYITRIEPTQTVMTVHFRPAGALAFLGCPVGELENACVGLADVWGAAADRLRAQLIDANSAQRRVAMLEQFLLDRLHLGHARLNPDVASVLHAAEQDPSMRVAKAHDLTGLSPKRLNAVFRHQVGLAPKAYFRVRRLQAALRALDNRTSGASIAAELGYFDQAHFVREFRSFTELTPTQYVQRQTWLPSHFELG